MTRAVSTALDAAVFLLLVSAAAATLTLPTGSPAAPDATPGRTVVATTTASVHYSLAPGARAGPDERFPRTAGPEFRRHAHGSLAGLLADAAARNASVDGRSVDHAHDGFRRAVVAAVRNATGPRTRVRAAWRPFPGAGVEGRVTAGPAPPADARVASETLVLDSGAPDARKRAIRAANRSGYAGVADVVATATVRALVPPAGMRLALHGDYPVDRLARHRYRRLGRLFGADVSPAVARERPAPANANLRGALAARFERTLRTRFDSPAAAARAVRVGRVRIVVRRWSA
ncbi:DUF7284 family protein [Halorarius halobius]|uniref:DUF7284 family protein n=1 Tax=Halorarius halobius TaxID=2962671 RepID=UPI0020CC583A|nr:hypothetical protein [Halorarius halobius]